MSSLRPLGPLGTLDRAFQLVRRGGSPVIVPSLAGGAAVAAAVLGAYYVERVEGVHSARALLAFVLVLAFWLRSVLLSGAARAAVRELWEGVEVPPDAGRPIDVVRTASVAAIGLWTWTWVLVAASLLGWFAVLASLPILALRGGVAPSWIARAACTDQAGLRAFFAAASDSSGRRANGVVLELMVLVGVIALAVNLFAAAAIALLLGRTLLGIDLAFVDTFLSVRNTFVLFSVGASTLVVFEPLRVAISVTYFVDARVRNEGLDLVRAVDGAIAAAARRGGASASSTVAAGSVAAIALLAGALAFSVAAGVARAQPPDAPAPAELVPLPPGTGPDGVAPPPDPASWDPTGTGMPPKQPTSFDALAGGEPAGPDFEATPTGDDDAVRERASEILERPEFREFADDRARGLREAMSRFIEWVLDRLLHQRDPPDTSMGRGLSIPMPPASFFLIVGGLLVALLLGYLIASRMRERRGAQTVAGADAGERDDPRERAPEAHLDDAATLAAGGRFRDALRSLYLATLVALDRRRMISFDPALTNWQYIRQMPRGAVRSDFASFTRLFDYKWYGEEETTERDYLACRALADRLCNAEREREAA